MCNFHASNSHPCLDIQCVSCTHLLYLLNNGKGSPGQMATALEGLTADPATVGFLLPPYLSGLSRYKPQGWRSLVNSLDLSKELTCLWTHPWLSPAPHPGRPQPLSFLFPLNLYYFGEAEVGEEKNPQILLKKLRNVKIFSPGQCERRGLLYGSTIHI